MERLIKGNEEVLAALGMAACCVLAILLGEPLVDGRVVWQVVAWYGFWLALAALYAYILLAARGQRRRPMPVARVQPGNGRDMGQDLKEMYEAISISLQQAQDARDALLQFCASNGYRALRKGSDFFVQDMTSGRVYRAEFQTFKR